MLITQLFDPPQSRDRSAGPDGSVLLRGGFTVPESDPVLDGHYPGFPLVPGLFLLEHVHRLVLAELGSAESGPLLLEKARFLRPVRAGDRVTVEVRLDRTGPDALAAAELRAEGEPAAEFRIHYPGGPR